MAQKQASFDALRDYLPAGSFEMVMALIVEHKVHLTVSRERQTKLGDYRHAWQQQNHRISVNGNLHPYAFLITLLHELAHLLAFEVYGRKIAHHGPEWKRTYGQLLQAYLGRGIFPDDVEAVLQKMAHNPAASSNAEDSLQRVLRRYESSRPGHYTVEEIAEGLLFRLGDGRVFLRGKQLRKRIKCLEVASQKVYLFHPLYEVQLA